MGAFFMARIGWSLSLILTVSVLFTYSLSLATKSPYRVLSCFFTTKLLLVALIKGINAENLHWVRF